MPSCTYSQIIHLSFYLKELAVLKESTSTHLLMALLRLLFLLLSNCSSSEEEEEVESLLWIACLRLKRETEIIMEEGRRTYSTDIRNTQMPSDPSVHHKINTISEVSFVGWIFRRKWKTWITENGKDRRL